jgi:hypothetical protein
MCFQKSKKRDWVQLWFLRHRQYKGGKKLQQAKSNDESAQPTESNDAI